MVIIGVMRPNRVHRPVNGHLIQMAPRDAVVQRPPRGRLIYEKCGLAPTAGEVKNLPDAEAAVFVVYRIGVRVQCA